MPGRPADSSEGPRHPSHWNPAVRHFTAGVGLPPAENIWASAAHAYSAYDLYLADRLVEAEAAVRRSADAHLTWIANLLYIISGELEARDFARRVERPPFIFELPADDSRYEQVVTIAEDCAGRVEKMLEFERPPTMISLLEPDSLLQRTRSHAGYMAPKEPYYKICLPRPEPPGIGEMAFPLVHEYMHVGVCELSDRRAPHWLTEGLAEWAEQNLLDALPEDELVLLEDEYPRLGHVEGIFHSGRSVDDEEVEYAYAAAYSAVTHLIALHGRYDVREFLVRLSEKDEGPAFRAAFGQSQRQFEHAWHEQLRREEP
jgi:hypothetical protein